MDGKNLQPAFLLAQVGAHAASKFAERLLPLRLTPPDVGILRLLRTTAGLSQRELSSQLGIHPSRLVAILDALEEKGMVERRPNPDDRREYSLHLTNEGQDKLRAIGEAARQHQEELCSSLSTAERESLAQMLQKIAEQQGLAPGIHPGYRWMKG